MALLKALARAIPSSYKDDCVLVTDGIATPAISAVMARSDLTGLRFPIVESLYSNRDTGGSTLRMHAVYLIAPEYRHRDVEAAVVGRSSVNTESVIRKDMRQYASPEQWAEILQIAEASEHLPSER